MGAFVSLLQRPPNETGFEAAAEGQNQALNAQSIMQQMQMRKEQIAAEQLLNEQKRKAAADEDIYRQSWTDARGNVPQFKQFMQQRGGNPDHVLAVEKHLVDIDKGYADLDKDKRAILEDNTKALGTTAQALLGLPDDAYAAQLPGAIDDLVARKHLTVEQGAELKANPPNKNTLRMFAAGAMSAEHIFNERKYKEDEPKRAAELADAQAKSLTARRKNASSLLETAAEHADTYTQQYNKTDEDVRPFFDHPSKYDPQKTAVNARRAGLSPEEKMIDERADVRADALAELRQGNQQLKQDALDLRTRMFDERKTDKAKSEEKDRKEATSLFLRYESQQARLEKLRRELGGELKTGTYKSSGRPIDTDTVQGMLDDVTNQLRNTVTDKHDAYEKTGKGKPKYSLQNELDAIEGKKTAPAAAPAATPAPATKPAAKAPEPAKGATKQPFRLKLDNEKVAEFPDQASAEKWLESQGRQLIK